MLNATSSMLFQLPQWTTGGIPGWVALFFWTAALSLSVFHCINIFSQSRSVAKVYGLYGFLCVSILLLSSTSHYGQSVSIIISIIGFVSIVFLFKPSLFNEIRIINANISIAEEKANQLENLASQTYEGIFLLDPKSLCYIEVNLSGAKALQYSVKEMAGMNIDRIYPDNMGLIRKQIHQAMNSRKWFTFIADASRKDKKVIKTEISLKKVRSNQRELILAVGRDLSRLIKSQTQIEQLNRLYQVVTQVNRAITRETDQVQLFQNICNIAIGDGGFLLAWVGDVSESTVDAVTYAGQGKSYIENLKIKTDDNNQAKGPVLRSIKEKKTICINNISEYEGFKFWKARAEKEGFKSAASVPLFVDSNVVATLVLYANQTNVFDERMEQLLNHLSEDVSFALNHKAMDAQNKLSQKRLVVLSSAIDQSAEAVTIINAERLIEYVNPRLSELTGFDVSEVIGQSPELFCYNKDEESRFLQVIDGVFLGRKWRGEFRKKNKLGEMYWSMDTLSPIRNSQGDIIQCVLTSEDYTALKQAQDKIEQLAFYDPLTGLPNRRLLHDRMNQAFLSAKKRGNKSALMFIDLDKFKSINDSLGHNAGDELLKTVALRLENSIRPGDTVARLGGDEFTVVIYSVNDLSDIIHVAERILEALPKPINLEKQMVSVTPSIGITVFPDDCDDIDTALRNADLAMYHAKSEGRNNFQFYTREMNISALGQIDFERKLRLAIPKKQFKLFYQPQIDLRTQKVSGVEALIRWVDDDGTLIPPDEFIPLAEESGLIWEIGEWVIVQACKDCRRLSNLFSQFITMAINISGHQFKHSEALMLIINKQIEQNQLDPVLIELELTESMLIEDVKKTVKYLNKFRELGVKLAIDDFGTGYSSLSYLKQFPINRLKIDRSFVMDIETDQDDAAIASAIIALAHELNIEVLAEGAETEGQLAFLSSHDCDIYQGYYYSRPVPFDDLVDLFQANGVR